MLIAIATTLLGRAIYPIGLFFVEIVLFQEKKGISRYREIMSGMIFDIE
jgi:hypothetical protein